MISAVILTKNEEKNIKECLKTLSWVNEIIIIDDFSVDKTIKTAKDLGARVFKRHLKDNFTSQRNFGLEKATKDWVLFVDADERVSSRLKDEILSATRGSMGENYAGFRVKRKDLFLGKWLRFGETASVKLLRLAKKDAGKWRGKVHEVWQIKGRVKTLKYPLLHEREVSVAKFLERIDKYSSLRAKELFNRGLKTNVLLIIAYPLGKFLQNYILRLGLLDGMSGLVMAIMMSIHSFLVRAKLYLLWHKKNKNG